MKMRAKNYYFCLDKINEDSTISDGYDPYFFVIVSIKYWEKYGYLDDRGGEPDCLPDGFYECAESIFEYSGSPLQGRLLLIKAGFVENIELGENPYTDENHEEWVEILSHNPDDFDDFDDIGKSKSLWHDYNIKNLEIMLKAAVEKEEFEIAAGIRDEINKRKQK